MINYFLAFVGRIGTIVEMNTEVIFIFNDVLRAIYTYHEAKSGQCPPEKPVL